MGLSQQPLILGVKRIQLEQMVHVLGASNGTGGVPKNLSRHPSNPLAMKK